MEPEVNVLVFFKGKHKYVFVYDDESLPELISTLRNHAAEPDHCLNWFDAAHLSERARTQVMNVAGPSSQLSIGKTQQK